jgi:DNA-binding NarL/FixJ family response regulator
MTGNFDEWLSGVPVLVVDDGESCQLQRAWLQEAGATVTHSPRLSAAMEAARTEPTVFELALLDADMLGQGWATFVQRVPASCAPLIAAANPDAVLLERVQELGAGFVSKTAPKADFLFAARSLVRLAAPEVRRLAARAARLWKLPPQQSRLLYYNLWGYSDRDIADALSISIKTAQQYQEELRRKTGVKSKHGYLRRLLTVAGESPPLPMTDHTRERMLSDRRHISVAPPSIDD